MGSAAIEISVLRACEQAILVEGAAIMCYQGPVVMCHISARACLSGEREGIRSRSETNFM